MLSLMCLIFRFPFKKEVIAFLLLFDRLIELKSIKLFNISLLVLVRLETIEVRELPFGMEFKLSI